MPITISIVTPCYNGARYIKETLQSALAQTHPPLEVIVIDDGSTDDSAALAAEAGPPVRVIRQANQGESIARNRGIAEAQGSHVLFLDADDLLEPESLSLLAAAVDGRPDAVAVMGCGWFTSDPASISSTQQTTDGAFFPGIIGGNLGPMHCWLTPTHILRRVGGFAGTISLFEDWDLWWRVGFEGLDLVPVKFIGAKYRLHGQSQMTTTKRADRARGHVVLMSRMAERFLEYPDRLDRHAKSLFWNVWSSLVHARDNGVGWDELGPAAEVLRQIARKASQPLRGTLMAHAVRLLGTRTAMGLQRRSGQSA